MIYILSVEFVSFFIQKNKNKTEKGNLSLNNVFYHTYTVAAGSKNNESDIY